MSVLEQLQQEQQQILNEIEKLRHRGDLKGIFPLQVEYAVLQMQINSIKNPK